MQLVSFRFKRPHIEHSGIVFDGIAEYFAHQRIDCMASRGWFGAALCDALPAALVIGGGGYSGM
jgi:hypothetical protein